jgi:hypothetical protein
MKGTERTTAITLNPRRQTQQGRKHAFSGTNTADYSPPDFAATSSCRIDRHGFLVLVYLFKLPPNDDDVEISSSMQAHMHYMCSV